MTQTLVPTDGTRESRTMSLRVYTATELLAMLDRAGFSEARCHGGFDGEPFATDTRLVISRAALASWSAQPDAAVLGERPVRVVGDLPRVPVGVQEEPAVAAPERLGPLAADRRAGRARLLEHRVDLLRDPRLSASVVPPQPPESSTQLSSASFSRSHSASTMSPAW